MQTIQRIVTLAAYMTLAITTTCFGSRREPDCGECEVLDETGACVPVADGTPCDNGSCCGGKCYPPEELCDCMASAKLEYKVVNLSHSSCGLNDDEISVDEKIKKGIIKAVANKIKNTKGKLKRVIRLMTSVTAARTFYAYFEYRCCQKISSLCCAWSDWKKKKVELNGPIAGCFLVTDFTSVIEAILNQKDHLCGN